jgi:hypothetical protein
MSLVGVSSMVLSMSDTVCMMAVGCDDGDTPIDLYMDDDDHEFMT